MELKMILQFCHTCTYQHTQKKCPHKFYKLNLKNIQKKRAITDTAALFRYMIITAAFGKKTNLLV